MCLTVFLQKLITSGNSRQNLQRLLLTFSETLDEDKRNRVAAAYHYRSQAFGAFAGCGVFGMVVALALWASVKDDPEKAEPPLIALAVCGAVFCMFVLMTRVATMRAEIVEVLKDIDANKADNMYGPV